MLTSCTLPLVMLINVGMLPCRSSKGVHLDGRLCSRNFGPRKQRQAQVDGGGVQRVQALIQFDANRIVRVQRSRDGRSEPVRSRRRCASHAIRWRRPDVERATLPRKPM